ncbi:hypothetical protein ACI2LF_34005 [Kribbella sp. NPDC020789]
MDVAKVNSLFTQARYEQRQDPAYDVRPVQEALRALVANEPESDDTAWALRLADKLAEPLPAPREMSALYDEAVAIASEFAAADAPVAEQVAALDKACERIWAIADRAPSDEAADIRALTQPLAAYRDELQPPTFP